MQAKPRIKFGTKHIDFDKINDITPSAFRNRVRANAASGKRSVASFYDKEKVEAVLDFEDAQKVINEIRRFYEYAKGGASFEFWRDRRLGGYWPFEGSTYSNNRVKGTFTRSSIAHFLNPDTGQIEQVAANAARFPAGKFGRGLANASTRANIVQQPSDLSHQDWFKSNVTIGANTPETLDPQGGANADKIVVNTAPGDLHITSATQIGTNDAVVSKWLKSQYDTVPVIIGIARSDTGALIAQSTVNVTPTWQRFELAYSNAGSIVANFRSAIKPQVISEVYHYSNQLEVGANQVYSTDDIDPLATAPATRTSELFVFPPGGIVNPIKGSFVTWLKPGWDYDKHNKAMLLYCDGVGGDRLLSLEVDTGGLFRVVFKDGEGGQRINAATTAFQILNKNINHRLALTWDLTVDNGVNLYADAALVMNSTNKAFSPNRTGTNCAIGSDTSGLNGSDSVFSDTVFWNEPLSPAEILRDFNRGSALALERNYWPALEFMIPEFMPEIIDGTTQYRYLLQALEVL